jgi:hypothetical protein
VIDLPGYKVIMNGRAATSVIIRPRVASDNWVSPGMGHLVSAIMAGVEITFHNVHRSAKAARRNADRMLDAVRAHEHREVPLVDLIKD